MRDRASASRRPGAAGPAIVLVALSLLFTGSDRASDAPDSEVNPQSGYIESVDSSLVGGNYEIRHAIRISQGQPSQVTALTSNSVDDAGARLAISPGGDTTVVWWRAEAVAKIFLRTRSYSSGVWSAEQLVSDASESSSHPRIVNDGTAGWVAYELANGVGTGIAVLQIHDEPNPFPSRTLLASTSYGGDVDLTLSAESGHLWVTWVDSAAAVGWCRYDGSTGLWTQVSTEPYSPGGLEAARSAIRSTVLAQ